MTSPLPQRITDKIDVGDCWEWTGAVRPDGYGYIHVGDRKMGLAHRVVWEKLVGEIPEGLDIDHLCCNRSCVNPDHLQPTTRAENLLRGHVAERAARKKRAQTHCKAGHPLTGENLYRHEGRRHCKACQKRRKHEYIQRTKANACR